MPGSGQRSVSLVVPTTSSLQTAKESFRVVVLGSAKVGKTAIINQFLYDTFPTDYKPTIEELHRGEYTINGTNLTVDVLDTSGSYEFPAMRKLAIEKSDAFLLVYSICKAESFEEIRRLREEILEIRKSVVPLVVAGNKCDRESARTVRKELAETLVRLDWESGYVECSAKENKNIVGVFQALLNQAEITYDLTPAVEKRRKSLPVHPTNFSPNCRERANLKRNSCALS